MENITVMNKNWMKALKNLSLISEVGISMVVPILGCLMLGNYIDKRFNSSPLFLFIFIVIGVGAAFLNLYKLTIKDTKRRK